mgnify:CR=1 FL=1
MRYVFSNWENGETNPTRTLTLIGDLTITATYALVTRKLTFKSEPVAVQAVIDGKTVSSGQTIEAPEGSIVTITIPGEVVT